MWSSLAGTFGQNEIWSTCVSSSWKHPAVPYEVLIDPQSVPNPEILNMETNASNSGGTHHRGGVKVSCVRCLECPDAKLICSCGAFAVTDPQLVLMTSNYTNQQVSEILHNGSEKPADAKCDTRLDCKHHGFTFKSAASVLHPRLCQANKLSTCASPKVLDTWDSPNSRRLVRIDSSQQLRWTGVSRGSWNRIDHCWETGSMLHPWW